MEHVKLGNTGLTVSEICLGTWRFNQESDDVVEVDRETAHDLLDAFADAGGNFVDTAPGYGDTKSEQWIGEWLADRAARITSSAQRSITTSSRGSPKI